MTSLSSINTYNTERLFAERLRPEHLADYRQLFQDEQVMATLSPDGKPLADEEVARWLSLSLEHWDRHGYGYWIFRTRSEKQFVGRAGLHNVQMEGKEQVELGYALMPEFWNQGLATEIAGKIVQLAFEPIGLPQIICYTLTTNRPSQRVMEKTGFRFDREMVHADLPHVLYRMTAPEFSTRFE